MLFAAGLSGSLIREICRPSGVDAKGEGGTVRSQEYPHSPQGNECQALTD